MIERRKPFPFAEFEPRWQRIWDERRPFRARNPGDPGFDSTKPKFYILDMFPYPSGTGLHVGHPEGYTATDIIARYKRMRGFNVLHPMGWDAFGLPAEQYAIKTGQHPAVTTRENVANFKSQLKRIGFSYDWQREINTTDPRYYKWTQWIFLQIYNSWFNPETQRAEPITTYRGDDPDVVRLAYVAEVPVNWCPELGTVLANEEVIDGKSEVGGFPVVRRPMRQWMLRITAFADRLESGLADLDWPEGIKALQRNWVGRSEGAEITFYIASGGEGKAPAEPQTVGRADGSAGASPSRITVFTTRPDTLYGATYMVLAPEHPLVDTITAPNRRDAVAKYRETISSKSDLERTDLAKEKSGVATGAFAINPANNKRIPIWIADYVLIGYGTGAIMGVPAHDERDFEFAKQFDLEIRKVVDESKEGGFASRRRVENPASLEEGFLDPHKPTEIHRRHLPHWEQDAAVYFITWRLGDSIPQPKLAALREDRARWVAAHPEPRSSADDAEFYERFTSRLDQWLDEGMGSCCLADPENGRVVRDALRFFDGQRYDLHAFCVMPNHVHVLVRPIGGEKVADVVHSWKRHTSREINRRMGWEGALWQEEYYDRLVRSWEHYDNLTQYIVANPRKAGLASDRVPMWVRNESKEDGFASRGRVKNPASLEADVAASLQTDVGANNLFTGDGYAVNSPLIDGLPTAEAKQRMIAWLEERSYGKRDIRYKLRDWLFSRQRYWGEPFPIVWEGGNHRALDDSELPLVPPELADFKPTGTGEPPLAKSKDWIRYSDRATRETNTMPQWAGSCWYYLRFCDPRNDARFVGEEAERYWMGGPQAGGIDLYVGGTEHAVLHLLYARFWQKVLFDLGHVSKSEPFHRLVNQGLILGEDGQKMSKSRGNVVNPDEVIEEYGADALRCYEMFMGPLQQMKPWSMRGVEGVSRFLARVWRLMMDENQAGEWNLSPRIQDIDSDKAQLKILHATIKKVKEDIESLSFNTAISQMMVFVNAFTNVAAIPKSAMCTFLVLLNPFAPHISSELWERMGEGEITDQTWPEFDALLLVEDECEIVLQVNGKVRDRIRVLLDAPNEELERIARSNQRIQEFTTGKTIRKVVVIRNKIVNVVAT